MAGQTLSALMRNFPCQYGCPSLRDISLALRRVGSRRASNTSVKPLTIAVVCPPGAAVLEHMPQGSAPCSFVVGNDMKAFEQSLGVIDSITFMANGGNPALLTPLFDACPNVRWVHSFFAGVDILAPFIKERLAASEVPLTNGRGAFSESLAEYVVAAMLHFNKRIPHCQANRISRRWDKFVMPVLKGKTIGLVGYGHIGQTTARLAKALGMKVIAVRRDHTKPPGLADAVYGLADKTRVFREADFVVSVLPGTHDTLNFCAAQEFDAMKPSGVFISIGRGVVVDEDALVAALKSGRIAGAALDVFKTEPLPQDSKLWECENLLLTAHNADNTDDYLQLGWGIWKQNFDAFVAGRALITLVDKSAGY